MSGRYARLKKDWMLRGWSDMPKALVNWTNSDQRELKNMGFYVAQSCDGQTDFESFAFLPRHQAMLDLLIAEGLAEECRKGDSIEPWQRYRHADNPRLTGIHWCVTGLCNLNCRHCYMESPSGRYGELPFKAMVGLVEQFERANVVEVSFTGGEPFVRKDLLDIMELLADKKIGLGQIFSNGLLITERHLESIRKIGLKPAFQISFDGVGVHDQMRGRRGIEQGVIEAIWRLRAADFPVAVSGSVDRLNIGSLAATYELMKKLDIQAWRIAAPQEMGNWRGTTTAVSLAEQADAYAPLLERWVKDDKPFFLQLCGFFIGGGRRKSQADLQRPAEIPPRPKYTPDSYDCGACREQPNLLSDGTLVPCPGFVDSTVHDRMPNLLREDLSKVWTSSFLRQIASMKKKDVLAKNPECSACDWFKECGAGCRASALMATGNLMAKDPIMCDLHKKGYKDRFRVGVPEPEPSTRTR